MVGANGLLHSHLGTRTASTSISGNYLWLDAKSISGSSGDDVTTWSDSSGSGKDVTVNSGCGTPKLGQASWDSSVPVVKFG